MSKKTGIEKTEGNTIVINDVEAFSKHLDKVTKGIKVESNTAIAIKKAKIKDNMFLDVEYSEKTSDGENKVTKSCTAPVHDDLKHEFAKLDQHLGNICEQYDRDGNITPDIISCKGFTIGGAGDNEGVCLLGLRHLDSSKVLNLTAPFTKWEDQDYENISELSQIIEACKHEVKLYLFEGKHQPEAQMEIGFPGESDFEENN